MNRQLRNHRANTARIAKQLGCSKEVAKQIDLARRSIRSLPRWLRR